VEAAKWSKAGQLDWWVKNARSGGVAYAVHPEDPDSGEPLPELTFHGLRRSAASLMLAGGADISTVSKLLGHASISITADVYSHLVAAVGQRAVDGAAALIAHSAHTIGCEGQCS
jgi:integrase